VTPEDPALLHRDGLDPREVKTVSGKVPAAPTRAAIEQPTKVSARGQEKVEGGARAREDSFVDAGAIDSGGAPSTMLGRGEVVGRYVVVDVLGAGGMGTVYAAEDPELDRKVALKLLHHGHGQARLLREAKALAKLAHPNVVTAHDVGTYDGRVFLAMELVDGTTLREWTALRHRTWRDVLTPFLHAARGLAAAHASLIVHRDFKPDNVLIGKDGRVRVLDFGLAGAAGPWLPEPGDDAVPSPRPEPSSAPPLTRPGTVMGTPAYMSPEQQLARPTDARTDQFSFAVSLWEGLYGKRPYSASTLAALKPDAAAPPLEVPADADVPAWLPRILRRALAFEPDARFPSMDALIAEIEGAVRGADAATRILGKRYELIAPVAVPGLDRAHRAVDKLNDDVVTIARVDVVRDPTTDDSTSDRISHLRRFRALAPLRHPHLVGVLDCGFDDERSPYFVLDLGEPPSSFLHVARRKPLALQLNLLAQLLRALAFLHRRGMVHGDLDASRVLVVGEQVKLLNLGATQAGDGGAPITRRSGALAGDAEARRAKERSVADDLRAFGQIAVELFSPSPSSVPGSGPVSRPSAAPSFGRSSEPSSDRSRSSTSRELAASQLLRGQVRADGESSARPSSAGLAALDVDPAVAAVIGRLVGAPGSPSFASVGEVMTALGAAIGRPLAVETAETRESVLQAARFVGRDAEMAALGGALREAVGGNGSAWLVGGESGAGKSRLLEELRTHALVRGALVLRGQEEAEGGSPYRLWRDALRWLALVTDLDELEASVLLPIVPDLGALIGREVPEAPELDGLAMHARLVEVVLRILRRQEQPVVVLLEDLQWARSDGLKLLQAMREHVGALPLLVVATYRSDERPALPSELPGMKPLALGRLSRESIAKLSVSMIGAPGERPDVLALLQRETEGNAFFLVEVVRALAEEAGTLDGIGDAQLPESVFAGGMRRVIQRRLQRVPERDRGLLYTAAVIGRRIDGRLLASLAPGVDIDAWAASCIDAAVAERHEGGLRFAHDKLREALLAEGRGPLQREMHARVAAAIENVYRGKPERAASLAHHHGAAGDDAKEAHYAAIAGEQATQHGAYPEAIALLERALALRTKSGTSARDLARIHANLGVARFYLLDLAASAQHLGQVSAALGFPTPRSKLGRTLALVWELCIQIAHRLLPREGCVDETRRAELLEASTAAARLSNIAIFANDELGVLLYGLRAGNLAERAGATSPLSMGLLGFAAGCVRMDGVARRYFERMHAGGGPQSELRNVATGTIAEASYLIGVGELDEAGTVLKENLALCARIGDPINASYANYLLGLTAFYRGQLEEARRRARMAQDGLGTGLSRHAAAFVTFEALLLCIDGKLDEAELRLRDVETSFTPSDRLSQAIWFGVLAMIKTRRGALEEARAAVKQAATLVTTSRVVGASGTGLLAGAAETYLASWRDALARGESAGEWLKRSRRVLRFGRAWSRVYPIGWPQTLLHEGRVASLRGDEQKARRAWQRSLALARAQSLVFFEALAHLELGRSAPRGSIGRTTHLSLARDRFAATGAAPHLEEVQTLLAADVSVKDAARVTPPSP
jgi:serine/threonine protein kinase/tetratricopeptide (TPR) repeat protein